MLDPSLLRRIAYSSVSFSKLQQFERFQSYLREGHKFRRGNGVDKLIQNREVEIVFGPGNKFFEICLADAANGIKIFITTALDLESYPCRRKNAFGDFEP